MRKIWFCLPVLVSFLVSCSKIELAGITDVVTIDVPSDYTSIEVESAIEVRCSDEYDRVQVESDVNVIPYVEIRLQGGELKIGFDKGLKLKDSGWNALRTVVTVPYSNRINRVSVSGASTFESDMTFSGRGFTIEASGASKVLGGDFILDDTFSLDISGSSRVECSLSARKLEIDASGASSLGCSGRVEECSLSLSGASEIRGLAESYRYSLETDVCSGVLSGGSSAYLRCDSRIACILSGGSRLYYVGEASSDGSETSGGSDIIHEQE